MNVYTVKQTLVVVLVLIGHRPLGEMNFILI